ncbi:ATP-binding protein [Candidatus Saganbacteria bacterium]|nr:ATP-binding protein [Candidatus Saganbacteria bacterium]
MIKRWLKIPESSSFFLFGPRQTGKSTLVGETLKSDFWTINLLLNEPFSKYSKYPELFRKEALQKIEKDGIKTIFVDEIQRIPALLNEIQFLMDHKKIQFILIGSSARKLRKGGANLLSGRAVERFLFPFIYFEIEDSFELEDILRFGSLPSVYGKNGQEKTDLLKAYADTYLREEIQAEGIVRNLGGFSRFLDITASQFGELVSFSNIGRECHLPNRTVQSYYEILEDTLIGFRLDPWRKSLRKRLSGHPKFYLFDLGITNAINRHLGDPPDNLLRGRLFEQFIVVETYRLLKYLQSEARIYYWRTNTGAEIDLVIEKQGKLCTAIEIKAKREVGGNDFSGFRSFCADNPNIPCFLVCEAGEPYHEGPIEVLPWSNFLKRLPELL